jgi:hypothetical protein
MFHSVSLSANFMSSSTASVITAASPMLAGHLHAAQEGIVPPFGIAAVEVIPGQQLRGKQR